ncbi:hypothetical protein L6452_17122 [Arctium lappa]|uniref:Uncharacterized protein n=1 Tax=Arctium lappa TaxID=4217 RepID=A0ACB9C2M8_ARCLA|nr:hypothetical protein L6452_17122 [Arctium lappa]
MCPFCIMCSYRSGLKSGKGMREEEGYSTATSSGNRRQRGTPMEGRRAAVAGRRVGFDIPTISGTDRDGGVWEDSRFRACLREKKRKGGREGGR